jgi:hypothetical protein
MKKLFILLLLVASPAPALADYRHELKTVVSGVVDGSYSHVKAIPSVYSMSSTGTTVGTMGKLTAPAVSNGTLTGVAATLSASASVSQTAAGASTSWSESYIQGSAAPSAPSLTHSGLTSLPTGGDVVSYSGGSNNGMAIGLTQAGAISLTPGASGSTISASISSVTEVN